MAKSFFLISLCVMYTAISAEDAMEGIMVRSGNTRTEALGRGLPVREVDEVSGTKIAESSRFQVDPEDELEKGKLLKKFENNPSFREIRYALGYQNGGKIKSGIDLDRVNGDVLDNNLNTARYVSNPTKVLANIKARGDEVEEVQGKIVAGDPVEINVLNMKECPKIFSTAEQLYCESKCGDDFLDKQYGCQKPDADAYCKLKYCDANLVASSFEITSALPAPGFRCSGSANYGDWFGMKNVSFGDNLLQQMCGGGCISGKNAVSNVKCVDEAPTTPSDVPPTTHAPPSTNVKWTKLCHHCYVDSHPEAYGFACSSFEQCQQACISDIHCSSIAVYATKNFCQCWKNYGGMTSIIPEGGTDVYILQRIQDWY